MASARLFGRDSYDQLIDLGSSDQRVESNLLHVERVKALRACTAQLVIMRDPERLEVFLYGVRQ